MLNNNKILLNMIIICIGYTYNYHLWSCNLPQPDCSVMADPLLHDEDVDQQQRRLQLINFGHAQWGFNNWSWSVSKQELGKLLTYFK